MRLCAPPHLGRGMPLPPTRVGRRPEPGLRAVDGSGGAPPSGGAGSPEHGGATEDGGSQTFGADGLATSTLAAVARLRAATEAATAAAHDGGGRADVCQIAASAAGTPASADTGGAVDHISVPPTPAGPSSSSTPAGLSATALAGLEEAARELAAAAAALQKASARHEDLGAFGTHGKAALGAGRGGAAASADGGLGVLASEVCAAGKDALELITASCLPLHLLQRDGGDSVAAGAPRAAGSAARSGSIATTWGKSPSGVPAALSLCCALLEAVGCRSVPPYDARCLAELALDVLRALRGHLASNQVMAQAGQALRNFAHLASRRTLGVELLRRAVAIATESLVASVSARSSSSGAVALALESQSALVTSIGCMQLGDRADGVQIALEVLKQRIKSLTVAAAGFQKHARTLVGVFVDMLVAVCAAPWGCPPAKDWMPAAYAEARRCARLVALAVIQVAAHGDDRTRELIERLAEEIAEASRCGGAPAAPMLMRAVSGALTALLRTAGTGDIKALVLRCLGRAAARLIMRSKSDEYDAAALCAACAGRWRHCKDCGAAGAVQPLCLHGAAAPDDAPAPGCDLCLARGAAPQAPDLCCLRVAALRGPWGEASALRFQLCEWAEAAWPEAGGEAAPALGRGLEAAWERLAGRGEAAPGAAAGSAERLRRWERRGQAADMGVKAIRAIVAQLRSPRDYLRAAGLRALADVARGNAPALARSELLPRRQLQGLASDPAPRVRLAALAVVGSVAAEDDARWAIGVARRAVAQDPSPGVQAAAARILSAFVRGSPSSPVAHEICAELVAHIASEERIDPGGGAGGKLGPKVLDDLREYVFGDSVKDRALQVLKLLATVHQRGAIGFLPSLLRAHRRAVGPDRQRSDVAELAAILLSTFSAAPEPGTMAGLQALSQAAPWALAGHLNLLGIFLAVGSPPAFGEEVLALGACRVLADVLQAVGPSAARAVSPWAWSRLDALASWHSSRLARPAMACLAIAAEAEGTPCRIIPHLRQAARLLRKEASRPAKNSLEVAGLVRAAWIAATACEHANIDRLLSLKDLDLEARQGRPAGVGEAVAADIVQIIAAAADSKADRGSASLPALVLALGFALRRHLSLAASPRVAEVFAAGLEAREGRELLAERSLEAYAQLVERLLAQAESAGAKGCDGGTDGQHMAPGDVAAHLAQHQPAILNLLQRGLRRRAEVSDMRLRSRALAAARALQKAGLAHAQTMAVALLPPMFADRATRRGAGALLRALVRQDDSAVASGVSGGLREAFVAMLWQAPHELDLVGVAAFARSSAEAAAAFAICGRQARQRWIRALLDELRTVDAKDFPERLGEVPAARAQSAATAPRLSPFGGAGRRAAPPAPFRRRVCAPRAPASVAQALAAMAAADPPKAKARLATLFGSFIACLLLALPLTEAEVEVVQVQCARHLELRMAAYVSAYEHGGGADLAASTQQRGAAGEVPMSHAVGLFHICMVAAIWRAVATAVVGATPDRPGIFKAVLSAQWPGLVQAEQASEAALASWLEDALVEGVAPCTPATRKRRRLGRLGATLSSAGGCVAPGGGGAKRVLAAMVGTPPPRKVAGGAFAVAGDKAIVTPVKRNVSDMDTTLQDPKGEMAKRARRGLA